MQARCARKIFQVMLVCFFVLMLIGCGESGSSDEDTGTTPDDSTAAAQAASVGLVADQNSISPNESTTMTAVAYNGSGQAMSGEPIEFVLDDPTLGSITASGETGGDGTFSAEFAARGSTGTVNVTASAGSVTSQPVAITIKEQSVENVEVSANPTTISVTNTATIIANVTDGDGNPVANGSTVNFSMQDPAFGTITQSANTNAGSATATFTAANFPGTATINATSGSASGSVDVVIEPAEAASIQFDSVSENPIAIRGTGGQESANITFSVKDVNGNPAEDIDVLFTMVSGIQGKEYLEEDDDSPYSQTVGTSGGTAEVTLHSGNEPGTVSITASITTSGGETISGTTPVISIGGGVPTDDWFTVSVTEPGWNMGGLACVNIQTDITAWLADRYGNYNVLDGHTVSFQSEVGLAVDPIGITDGGTGAATSTVRTQGQTSAPKDVLPETWEQDLKSQLSSDFSGGVGDPLPSGHPRDGVCNVLIFTVGEESFVDGSNYTPDNEIELDGLYNEGEDFVDTADDPWRDYDDDGLWDDGSATTPFTSLNQDPVSFITANPEEDGYQDRAGNSIWDGPNGEWDGNKNLFRQVDFLITGKPFIRMDKGSFTVPNGGSDTVRILICDRNYNPLSAGSSYNVSVDVGKITSGTKSYDYPSSSFYGSKTTTDWDTSGGVDNSDFTAAHYDLIVNEITISDDDPNDGDPNAEQAELSVTVTWTSNGGCADDVQTLSISGEVN